ncbi:hypothetical protein APSETT444_009733 [Aspergillus pseudonomiae]
MFQFHKDEIARSIEWDPKGFQFIEAWSFPNNEAIILKAPQKYEIANYMLSLTHDTSSQWTTALLAGEDIIDLFPSMEDYRSERPFRFQVPGRTIRTSLAESPELWNNPLTLPCILITDHLKRVQQFCTGSLTQQVMVIEEHLGVTMVGRRNQPRFRVPTNRTLSKDADMLNLGIPVDRSQTHFLTVSINSKLTSILFTRRSPKWNYEASQFLLNIMNEASGEWHGQHSRYNQINELIEHNIYLAKSIEEHVLCLQARMELQLDVVGWNPFSQSKMSLLLTLCQLYSFVAQSDNRLNARLAASTGRDSTSMKILAFITTIFLPGTFIAL